MMRVGTVAMVTSVFLLFGQLASAQPLGTFRWQQQPYCNVLTVQVVQSGNVFHLDGIDDQCGAATQASVVGLAFQNPSGSIGLGFTIVTSPGGTPLHLDATVSLPGASGTWRDSAGNTGAFALTAGAAVPGSPRPVPRASFPGGLSAGNTAIVNVGTPVAPSDAATKQYVDAATGLVRSAMIGEKVWKAHFVSNGAKNSEGPYTSSRSGVGQYLLTFDVTGLGLPLRGPIIVASPWCSNGVTAAVGASALIVTGGTGGNTGSVIGLQVGVNTFNAAGAPMDCGAFVMVSQPDADSGSPVPPLDATRGMRCVPEGAVTKCTFTPE